VLASLEIRTSQAFRPSAGVPGDSAHGRASLRDAACQADQLPRVGFTVAPIRAGIDKSFHPLVNWDNDFRPPANNIVGGHGHTFMRISRALGRELTSSHLSSASFSTKRSGAPS
jgi:hypothetical protein